MKNGRDLLRLSSCVGVSLLAGFFGSLVTTPAIPTWYAALAKPVFNPPNWIFAPVWTILYLLMAVSAFLVWRRLDTTLPRTPAIAFTVQLALNVLWSVAFFGLRSPGAGMVVIAILFAAILWMIAVFRRVSPVAAYLQVPYAAWVGFASLLNISIFVLN